MSVTNSLRLVSYNCRGWNNGSLLVSDLLSSCDICLIQEYWLLHEKLDLLDINPDFLSYGISGMDLGILLRGRPYGGCAILYRKSLSPIVSVVSSHSSRFCAISLSDMSCIVTLLVCVYLPTDYGTAASYDDYLCVLGELDGFIESQTFDHIVIGGDFNVDFNRPSGPLNLLSSFMTDHDLVAADSFFRHLISFSYERDDGSCKTWPDHFLCDSFSDFISICKVDSGSNLSDHHPLAATLSFNYSVSPPTPSHRLHDSERHLPKIAWHRATSDVLSAYCSLVSLSLSTLPAEAAACSVVGCTDHTAVLDTYVDSLYHCLHDCTLRTLPKVRASPSCVPGWNRTARLLKDKANFWFSVWKSAGSPSNGVPPD